MSAKCPPNVHKVLELIESSDFAGLVAIGSLSARESRVENFEDPLEDLNLGGGKILPFPQIASRDKLFKK